MSVSAVPRGLCVGIYVTNSAEACQYVIKHAKVNILLVENDQQLQKILSVSGTRGGSVLGCAVCGASTEDLQKNCLGAGKVIVGVGSPHFPASL